MYKPLLKLLHDRRDKIELGLTKAEEADRRLHEVDELNKGKIKHAEAEAIGILKKTESDAKVLEGKLLADAKRREGRGGGGCRRAAAFAGGGFAPRDGERGRQRSCALPS